MTVTLVVGTEKGAFLLRSDRARRDWDISGPQFKGWKVTATARDEDGRYFAATASQVYGPALHVSDDLHEWRQIEQGPTWNGDGERKLNQVWTIVPSGSRVYAGVDEAGLFVSDDRGETWSSMPGLNEHPTRSGWCPGAGGLCAHAVLVDPADPKRLWVGISAVGVFRSDDGGETWVPKNEGVPTVIEDKADKSIGRCVHGMVADPDDANTIYRREHVGMFRTRDGGESWERIENGLPDWFGFPIALNRADGSMYVIPLESDEYRIPRDGKLLVFRSRDGGDSWEPRSEGLPASNVYAGVLRGAMDVDHLSPGGVYFGTTGGSVHTSADGGDSWQTLPCTLPRVLSVRAYTE